MISHYKKKRKVNKSSKKKKNKRVALIQSMLLLIEQGEPKYFTKWGQTDIKNSILQSVKKSKNGNEASKYDKYGGLEEDDKLNCFLMSNSLTLLPIVKKFGVYGLRRICKEHYPLLTEYNKDHIVRNIVGIITGEGTDLTKRKIERQDIKENKPDFSFFYLCEQTIPLDVFQIIFGYIVRNKDVLNSVGLVNTKWHLFLQAFWNTPLVVTKANYSRIPTLLLLNIQKMIFRVNPVSRGCEFFSKFYQLNRIETFSEEGSNFQKKVESIVSNRFNILEIDGINMKKQLPEVFNNFSIYRESFKYLTSLILHLRMSYCNTQRNNHLKGPAYFLSNLKSKNFPNLVNLELMGSSGSFSSLYVTRGSVFSQLTSIKFCTDYFSSVGFPGIKFMQKMLNLQKLSIVGTLAEESLYIIDNISTVVKNIQELKLADNYNFSPDYIDMRGSRDSMFYDFNINFLTMFVKQFKNLTKLEMHINNNKYNLVKCFNFQTIISFRDLNLLEELNLLFTICSFYKVFICDSRNNNFFLDSNNIFKSKRFYEEMDDFKNFLAPEKYLPLLQCLENIAAKNNFKKCCIKVLTKVKVVSKGFSPNVMFNDLNKEGFNKLMSHMDYLETFIIPCVNWLIAKDNQELLDECNGRYTISYRNSDRLAQQIQSVESDIENIKLFIRECRKETKKPFKNINTHVRKSWRSNMKEGITINKKSIEKCLQNIYPHIQVEREKKRQQNEELEKYYSQIRYMFEGMLNLLEEKQEYESTCQNYKKDIPKKKLNYLNKYFSVEYVPIEYENWHELFLAECMQKFSSWKYNIKKSNEIYFRDYSCKKTKRRGEPKQFFEYAEACNENKFMAFSKWNL